jgi:hypothetical protein
LSPFENDWQLLLISRSGCIEQILEMPVTTIITVLSNGLGDAAPTAKSRRRTGYSSSKAGLAGGGGRACSGRRRL